VPKEPSSPEEIVLAPTPQHEGELGRQNMPQVDTTQSEKNSDKSRKDQTCKCKHTSDDELEVDMNEPRQTQRVRRDYRELADPQLEWGEEEEETFLASDKVYAIIPGDELTSLDEAKASEDWLEWNKAMHEELNQQKEMGTWKLEPLPPGTVAIPNKWTFVKKQNKEGDVIRHKARLVIKGCAQQPRYDYVETFSPVVRLDTLWAILALVPSLNLIIQQMDVKSAYLNSVLEEVLYMMQPEGCEDSMELICRLIKTIYGLKQAGLAWNKQLDKKLQARGYKRLLSDPCMYIRWDKGEFTIITVWVDDLLLFALSPRMMEEMKANIKFEWVITDLGEPWKIVGIEITPGEDEIRIS
jgi:hypothetical protein